jgi:hypothetical protein
MIQKPDTRTNRLNRLSRCAKRDDPVSLEDRARLEISEHFGNQAKTDTMEVVLLAAALSDDLQLIFTAHRFKHDPLHAGCSS